MARSLFIQNTDRPAVMKAQFRRLKDELRGSGLLLEGPFRDKSDAIARLSDDVTARMKFGSCSSLVGAAIATLAPQNHPSSERSWLKVPFIVTRDCPAGLCECAGTVAGIEASVLESTQVRAVDMDGITLVGVAVLRSLGIPAFFSYMHFDRESPKLQALRSLAMLVGSVPVGEPVASITVLNPEPEIFTFLPPYAVALPTSQSVSGFEILDDEAVSALMQMKGAYESCLEMMQDFAEQKAEGEDEATFRAMGIGHRLYSGMTLWSGLDAQLGLEAAISFFNPTSGSIGMESIRSYAERDYVHNIICPEHHSMLASEVMLGEETKGILETIMGRVLGGKAPPGGRMVISLAGDSHLPGMMAYLRAAEIIREHVHGRQECPVAANMN